MDGLLGVKREFVIVEVDGGDSRVWLASLSDLRCLGVVYQDRQFSQDDRLDLEQIVRVNPNYALLVCHFEYRHKMYAHLYET